VYWQQFTTSTGPDWFNKYAVTSVSASDPGGGSPGIYTSYAYSGAAWHYDDNELVAAKYRTYGQWRGYHQVITYTGTGTDAVTESAVTYYQGMSDDNDTTAVTLTDSQGGTHDDTNALQGKVLETTQYNYKGGPIDNSAIDSYWVSAAAVTRDRTGLPALTANATGKVESWTRQLITSASPSSWRETETDTSYDTSVGSATFGLPLITFDHGDLSGTSQQRCTALTYAPANTTLNLTGLVAETETDAVACGGSDPGGASAPSASQVNTLTAPSSVSRPAQVVSDTRTYYDDPALAKEWPQPASPAWPQPTPGNGDVSVVRQASGYSSGAFTYQTESASVYDSYGRVTTAYDGNGNPTSTAYTETDGVTTKTVVTNALGRGTTTTLDPERGLPVTVTDPNGITTTMHYDGLGRLTDVWRYGRATTSSASDIYSYDVSQSGPTVVTTQTLNDEGGYVTSATLYDSLLRVRQTQAPTPQGGVLVTDHFYDSRGWEWKTNTQWWDSSANPGGTVLTVPDSQVTDQTETIFDGLGRAIEVTSYDDSTIRRVSYTAYQGDRVITVPPPGGTPTATVTDALGRTTETDDYTTRPTVTTSTSGVVTTVAVTGGTWQATTDQYNAAGQLTTIEDPTTGEQWTRTYDLLGQVTSSTDPNAGATTNMTYDGDGNLISETTPTGHAISYAYDGLNRKTAEYDGATSASPLLASWVYDNSDNAIPGMSDPIGHLTAEKSYSSGNTYTIQQTGFNVFGESLGEKVTLPAAEGTLANVTYTLSHLYSSTTGLLLGDSYPASPGGALPAETVMHGYQTGLDLPAGLSGLAAYTQSITWNAYFQMQQEEIGSTTANAYLTDAYDPSTGDLTDSRVQNTTASSAPYDDTSYGYDESGNITSETDTRDGTETETQCFAYDTLDRLTEAWTAAGSCKADPSANSGATVGDGIAGSAYWTSWTFSPLGDRLTQTQHSLAGGANTVTSYGYTDTSHPDAVTSASVTGGSTTSYTYNADGSMKTRGSQSLTWTGNGKLASDGTTSYIYDADGNILLVKAPGKTTLYLFGGAEQLVLDTSANTVTGTRFIALPGGGEAVRTGTAQSAFTFEFSDQHGTGTLTLNSSCTSPQWRQLDPYGNPRGTAPSSWPDTNAFLGKPADTSTGLDIVGARDYDPALGRFISQDPVLDSANSQDLNGYNYSTDNPVTLDDPTGLCPIYEYTCPGPPPPSGGGGTSGPPPPPPSSGPGSGSGTGSGSGSGWGNSSGCPIYASSCEPTPMGPQPWPQPKPVRAVFRTPAKYPSQQTPCAVPQGRGGPSCVSVAARGGDLTPQQGRDVFFGIMAVAGGELLGPALGALRDLLGGGTAAEEGAGLSATAGQDAEKSTAVIGRLPDTGAARDWPGHEVLNVQDWTLAKNDQWVQSVIDRKMDVYVSSNPTWDNLWDAENDRPTVFARELDQFINAGYTWDGWTLVPQGGG
jgi:RHS repeat-associated protein